jgi:hypothetical protein
MSNYTDEIPLLTGISRECQEILVNHRNSCYSWPNVVGLLSWLINVVRCARHQKLMNIMFNHEDDEVSENFLESKTMLFYY